MSLGSGDHRCSNLSKHSPFQICHRHCFLPGFAFTSHPVSLDIVTLPVCQALVPAAVPVAQAISGVSGWHSVQKASPTLGNGAAVSGCSFLGREALSAVPWV